MLAAVAWFGLTFTASLKPGYFLATTSVLVIVWVVFTEMRLPPKTPYELYLATLPPDHPERLAAGDFALCEYCQTFNEPLARVCRACGLRIYH
jgi:uncharacterized paraquat-inducible protein A